MFVCVTTFFRARRVSEWASTVVSSFSVLRLYAHSHPLRERDPVLRDMWPIWRLNKTLQQFSIEPLCLEKGENLDF